MVGAPASASRQLAQTLLTSLGLLYYPGLTEADYSDSPVPLHPSSEGGGGLTPDPAGLPNGLPQPT